MTLALSKVSKALYTCMYLATQFYEATLHPKEVTHKSETVQWFSSDSCPEIFPHGVLEKNNTLAPWQHMAVA